MVRVPSEDITVIVMDNISGTNSGVLSSALTAAVLGKPYTIPQASKEIVLDAGMLKEYTGEYEFMPTFTIKVFLEGTRIKAQATNQPSFEIFAEKKDLFFVKLVEAKLEFIRNEKGDVVELILHQNGMSPKAKKVK